MWLIVNRKGNINQGTKVLSHPILCHFGQQGESWRLEKISYCMAIGDCTSTDASGDPLQVAPRTPRNPALPTQSQYFNMVAWNCTSDLHVRLHRPMPWMLQRCISMKRATDANTASWVSMAESSHRLVRIEGRDLLNRCGLLLSFPRCDLVEVHHIFQSD